MMSNIEDNNTSSSYKCMYVIPKKLYKSLITVSSESQSSLKSPSEAVVCGKDFKHPNILAHHMKSHVDGYKCNICNKVFTHQQELQNHLTQHATLTSKKYDAMEEKKKPAAAATTLHCPICKRPSKHKRNLTRHIKSHDHNCLNFHCSNWMTLQ